jgi:IclR family mhp operon transcriptional activator
LLVILNQHNGANIRRLSDETGLPKATTVRLLQTLMEAGYVGQDSNRGEYYVTSAVYRLCRGFWTASLLVGAARPYAAELTRRLKWPISVAVPDEDAMVIAFSTIQESPISWRPPAADRRLPVLTRGHGKAYLAFCSPEQQRLMIGVLSGSKNPEDALARNPAALNSMLNEIRKNGYAERNKEAEPINSTTIAVPILFRGDAVASLGVSYYRAAISPEEAVHQYKTPLAASAEAIGSMLESIAADGARPA